MRHAYLAVGMLSGVLAMVKIYQFSFQFFLDYEDALDQLLFEYVKNQKTSVLDIDWSDKSPGSFWI